jgi:hypothetical protein
MTSGAMMFIADFMKIRQLTQKLLWVKYSWQGVLCPPDSVAWRRVTSVLSRKLWIIHSKGGLSPPWPTRTAPAAQRSETGDRPSPHFSALFLFLFLWPLSLISFSSLIFSFVLYSSSLHSFISLTCYSTIPLICWGSGRVVGTPASFGGCLGSCLLLSTSTQSRNNISS